ncbi:MAG: hypothetical protein ACI9ZF_003038 [Bradyrhizobium sp.]|jgi:hypothetical protein
MCHWPNIGADLAKRVWTNWSPLHYGVALSEINFDNRAVLRLTRSTIVHPDRRDMGIQDAVQSTAVAIHDEDNSARLETFANPIPGN